MLCSRTTCAKAFSGHIKLLVSVKSAIFSKQQGKPCTMDLGGAWTLFLAIVIPCLFLTLAWNKMYRNRALPPGPTPLPIIGNMLQLCFGQMAKSMIKLSEQYGDVYTVYLGSRPVVVLHGYDAVKEALEDHADEFSGRGTFPTVDGFFQGFGTLFDPTTILTLAFSNIIYSIVFNERFDYQDKESAELVKTASEIFEHVSSRWGQMLDIFPTLMKYIPGRHQKIIPLFLQRQDFIAEKVKKHQQTLDLTSPHDYIDCFLIQMEKEKNNLASVFNMKNLLTSVENLFFAGTETASTTIRSGLLVLLKYPEIEEKIHEEIDRVIGPNRSAVYEDRSQMPYTEAVLHEMQRFADVLPMNLPHQVMQDITFRGYFIPKGTDVMPLLCSVLRDSKVYKDPENFHPEHFLDENGGFKKNRAFMPFSAGKRLCLGDVMAKMELFLFLVAILQNFSLHSPVDPKDIDINPRMTGFANQPLPYEISFVPR
ncbi:cytochrome P450 2G1-like isoform X2 [Pleurodeles waltl]|uniref:cytochrome P450 2G1-like isoform X2 n=1 Tax=Pleurodeles waltl TaxID=8319 RepID=UPI0037095025